MPSLQQDSSQARHRVDQTHAALHEAKEKIKEATFNVQSVFALIQGHDITERIAQSSAKMIADKTDDEFLVDVDTVTLENGETQRTFFFEETEEQEVGEDENGDPIYDDVVIREWQVEVVLDGNEQFLYEVDGKPIYVSSDRRSPTVREFMTVFSGLVWYAHFNGDLTAEEADSFSVVDDVDTTDLGTLLEAWK